jgi:hypothetical protein
MINLKDMINALPEKTRFGFILFHLLFGLSMSCPLSAQQSAGHTVTIRIIRPILFSIAPVENRFQADLRQKNNELQLNWKSDSKPKKVTVSRKSDNPGSKMDLILSSENPQEPQSRMRLEAVEENLAGVISKTAGSLTMRYDSGSKSRGVSEGTKEQIFYTVMDI